MSQRWLVGSSSLTRSRVLKFMCSRRGQARPRRRSRGSAPYSRFCCDQEGSGRHAGCRSPCRSSMLWYASRMGSIFASYQTDPNHPLIDKPSILAGADVPIVIDPARKDVIVHSATPTLKPCQQASPGIRQQLKLNRTACLLLHYDCPRSDLPANYNVADLQSHKVAATQLAINREVKQRTVTQSAALIEEKSNFLDLLRLKRALRAHPSPAVPDRTLGGRHFYFRRLHDHSPVTTMVIPRMSVALWIESCWEAFDQIKPFTSSRGMAEFSPKTANPRTLRQMPDSHSVPGGSKLRSGLICKPVFAL